MTYQLLNFPRKNDISPGIQCRVESPGFVCYSQEGWRICDISNGYPEATASDIADVLRLARDAGYAQALQDVRKTLGIK